LLRIESNAFTRTRLDSVVLPESVLFITGNAFPCSCDVRIANIESYLDLEEWNKRGRSGSGKAFKRDPSGQPQASKKGARK
jgi:hypothetical protein